jgi:hypothetical protein
MQKNITRIFAEKMEESLGCAFNKPSSYKNQPSKVTAKQAALILKGKKNIMIFTGFDISPLPEFKVDDPFWKTR